MKTVEKLKILQSANRDTIGLEYNDIIFFLKEDKNLKEAIDMAYENAQKLKNDLLWQKSEKEQSKILQEGFVNFYNQDTVNPYVSLAAKGPWIITSKGAVLHDSGGYGMLGFGQNPDFLQDVLNKPQVMANIMTPHFAQRRFIEQIRLEIGHTRDAKATPYAGFICLNSGSEAMTLATRLSDIGALLRAKSQTPQKRSVIISQKGSFHGRTERPAQISDSSRESYRKHLASFQKIENAWTVVPNDNADLKRLFKKADTENIFIEAVVIEPVMGEGDPGKAMEKKFYEEARRLCDAHGSLLIIDSIQAGLRSHGVLSVVDYPGFKGCKAPDIECFSKALNAGQYPLSVLALSKRAKDLYKTGIYGNTMTSNPRALDVACAVLQALTPSLRKNIKEAGEKLLKEFRFLAEKYPDIIVSVQGTGLLLSIDIEQSTAKVVGENGLEQQLRKRGMGVIHGGTNALRFTPHFALTDKEIEWIVKVLDAQFATLKAQLAGAA